jgi:hypothetical protein
MGPSLSIPKEKRAKGYREKEKWLSDEIVEAASPPLWGGFLLGAQRVLDLMRFCCGKSLRLTVILSEAKNLRGFRDPSLRSG